MCVLGIERQPSALNGQAISPVPSPAVNILKHEFTKKILEIEVMMSFTELQTILELRME